MINKGKGRAVVIGGGEISSYSLIKSYLKSDDYFIFCDSGLYHKEKLGVRIDKVIGDFDSHPVPQGIESVILPSVKDDTDSLSGVKMAFELGFIDFLLLGMTGRRMDHTLANIYLLDFIEKKGGKGVIVDDWCQMEIVGSEKKAIPDTFPYFSLIAWKGRAEGINILNAAYPLQNAVIDSSYQYGISNEPKKGGSIVWVEKGSLLLIKDFKKEK